MAAVIYLYKKVAAILKMQLCMLVSVGILHQFSRSKPISQAHQLPLLMDNLKFQGQKLINKINLHKALLK